MRCGFQWLHKVCKAFLGLFWIPVCVPVVHQYAVDQVTLEITDQPGVVLQVFVSAPEQLQLDVNVAKSNVGKLPLCDL